MMQFTKNPGTPLNRETDVARIAHEMSVAPAQLYAFLLTEAAGSGFDSHGRLKMLYEPHIFYRLLGAGTKRDKAVKAGVAYAKQGTKPYPKDSYPNLTKAMQIDEEVALQSASWGIPQIMGMNHENAGYSSAKAMVEDFRIAEDNQVEAMERWLVRSGYADEVRLISGNPDTCRPAAKAYNGSSYAINNYHVKMAANFKKAAALSWDGDIPTPFVAPTPAPESVVDMKIVQSRLQDLGYTFVGAADGVAGNLTHTAILAFKRVNDLPTDSDQADPAFMAALLSKDAKPFPKPEGSEDLTVQDLRDQGSTTIARADEGSNTTAVTAVGGGVTAVLSAVGSNFQAAREYVSPIMDFFDRVPGWLWGILVIGIALYLGHVFTRIKNGRLEAQKDLHTFSAAKD